MIRILKTWNGFAKRIKDISTHKSLDSRVFIKYGKKRFSENMRLEDLLKQAIAQYPEQEIIDAITNYFNILINDDYFWDMKYKGLGQFIYAGLNSGGGFVKFLNKNNPFKKYRKKTPSIYSVAKRNFLPITIKNSQQGYNKDNLTYYGFHLEELNNVSSSKLKEIEQKIDNYNIREKIGYFWELERCIAHLLWTKKTNPNPSLLEKLFTAWNMEKDLINLDGWFD